MDVKNSRGNSSEHKKTQHENISTNISINSFKIQLLLFLILLNDILTTVVSSSSVNIVIGRILIGVTCHVISVILCMIL